MKMVIWHVQGTDIYKCVQFDADPNKNQDVISLNVVSCGDCCAYAEVCTPLCAILVFKVFVSTVQDMHMKWVQFQIIMVIKNS